MATADDTTATGGSDPLEGTPYRAVRRLGGGAMGDVFEAEHVLLARTVVVKLLREELSDRPEVVDRMRVEAQALARLDHPNLVAVSDFGRSATGRTYLVLGSAATVTGLTGAVEIAAGGAHTCARLQDGSLRCWGLGVFGQLGHGSLQSSATPVTVSGINGATQLAAGRDHTCAVEGGRIYCWGRNEEGALGIGSTTYPVTPARVQTIDDAVMVAAGERHTCAIDGARRVFCWGDGANGATGTGDQRRAFAQSRFSASKARRRSRQACGARARKTAAGSTSVGAPTTSGSSSARSSARA